MARIQYNRDRGNYLEVYDCTRSETRQSKKLQTVPLRERFIHRNGARPGRN